MVKLNLPLRPWVPQWLGIVTMFVVMFPIIMLNGTYTGSMLEVSSTLGILSEDITMGYYAAAAGMAVAYPIIPKIRAIATPKTLLLTDLLLQIILSFVCAQVGNMDITIICSFFIGFLKAFIMLEFIIQDLHLRLHLTQRRTVYQRNLLPTIDSIPIFNLKLHIPSQSLLSQKALRPFCHISYFHRRFFVTKIPYS